MSMDRQSAAEVAEHLAKLGHTRIAMISGPRTYRSSIERLAGFSNALADRGLTLPPEYIAEGAYTFESGAACAECCCRARRDRRRFSPATTRQPRVCIELRICAA